jgi:hypothetical protein
VKIAISFISGIIVCSLCLIGARNVLPIRADTDNSSGTVEAIDNGFAGLLPDIETIYHEALTKPFVKAESKIYDADIAEFYGGLLDSCGLRETGGGAN